ncbi:MAG: EscU/YscU/HrcU family type III secretion system export apparatus switch protein, partial [Candidatus Eremiobacteraeota bacterium]|nr:EscU/YscU/HrcU family type III secretion system export apparatus switch protein [Candidatus Eremiobacteraeota bacterium]
AAVPGLSSAAAVAFRDAAEQHVALSTYTQIAALASSPIAAAAVAAIACATLQSGGVAFVAPSPKFERLAPAEGFKRMVSRETAVTALRASCAFAVAIAAITPAFSIVMRLALHSGAFAASIAASWNGAERVAIAACAVGAFFAAIDYGIARSAWRKKLRMSFDDLKRDLKESDGDPHTRARRRSLHRSLSRGAISRVKDAAFVVTNPTHIAVALEYAPPAVSIPRVLVRAADDAAFRVREAARAHDVPCIENVPLARALYAACKPGDVIAQEQYIAVAEIVAALAKAGVL